MSAAAPVAAAAAVARAAAPDGAADAGRARQGLLHGVLAYGLWGGVAVYWKLFTGISPVEVIAHRAVWGLGALLLLGLVVGQRGAVRAALRDGRTVASMALSGALLAVNWCTFVYATTSGQLLQASLGYFVNPLVSVGLGTLVLRERLRPLQWAAIAIAVAGVFLIWRGGQLPWIALVLASTFSLYGLVRKMARVEALAGSTVETLLLAIVGVIYLSVLAAGGSGALGHASTGRHLLLLGTGVVTAVPLVLFASAARRLPLSTVGFLQYLAPTGQFLLAVVAFGEPLARDRLVAFAVIWAALALFSADLYRTARRR
jgi:chloramphenicol-sensitive protein RarD